MSGTTLKQCLRNFFTFENVIFISILCVIVGYLFFQIIILNTSNPQVAVTTTSMVPTYQGFDLTEDPNYHGNQYYDILRGDLLIVQNIEPRVGDVVVFSLKNLPETCGATPSPDTPIVHRIIAEKIINGQYFYATKGDHNQFSDTGDCEGNHFGWIPRSNVLGVVVFSIHYLGWFSLQLQNPFIKALLIVAIITIIVIEIFNTSFKKDSSEQKSSKLKKAVKQKKIYLKINKKAIRINYTRFYVFFILITLFSTYFTIGLANYTTGSNSVTWIKTDSEEKDNIINLLTNKTGYNAENYTITENNLSYNLYFYHFQIAINSSGSLNFVNKVTIQPMFINFNPKGNYNTIQPTFVWTIVYDYYGSKQINGLLLFKLPVSLPVMVIAATLTFTVYSTGLLASPPIRSYSNVSVLA